MLVYFGIVIFFIKIKLVKILFDYNGGNDFIMKSVFSWFITAMAVIFWIFRVIITIMATLKVDYIITPIDINIEIALLFLAIPCLISILKRKIVGGIVYFGLYAWYFGTELAKFIQNMVENNMETLSMSVVINTIVCIVAVLIALLNLMDVAFSKYRKSENPSKKVDWFYKNEKFDRELDERSDKNNYRIY